MQRAQSGAQAAQCGAVRALMRHWPVAAAAAVAWPIDAGSANAGSVRALGGRARSACELAGPAREQWLARERARAGTGPAGDAQLSAGVAWRGRDAVLRTVEGRDGVLVAGRLMKSCSKWRPKSL